MGLPDDLATCIDESRITYPDGAETVAIRGSPFTCDFTDPVDPEAFCDEIRTAEEPWQMFGLKSQISDDYWKVVGNLFHVEDGAPVDSSKISIEVAPEWARIYVQESSSAERVADFVRTLDEEFGVTVQFTDPDSE